MLGLDGARSHPSSVPSSFSVTGDRLGVCFVTTSTGGAGGAVSKACALALRFGMREAVGGGS